MAADYDLELVQGKTYERTFRWLIDGVAQDLSSYTIRSQARAKDALDAALLLDLTQYMTLEVSDTAGQLDRIRLRVPATVTRALNPKAFKATAAWDLFLIDAADPTEAFPLAAGAASCAPAATALS